MPTGAGKTFTAATLAARAVSKRNSVLWLAHRAELVDQAVSTLKALGLWVGAISASATSFPDPNAPIQVATVQTLLARNIRPNASIIVADEAHHYVAQEFGEVVRSYPEAYVIGLTATPERGDGIGLGELFEKLVVGTTVADLVCSGDLVPAQIQRPSRPLGSQQIAQHPFEAWKQFAEGRKTIVFHASVAEAEKCTEEFGGLAETITGKMPWGERVAVLDRFRRGETRVINNVFVLTEGFDVPDTSCVILARGAGSIGIYHQMVGRALRPAPGKTDAVILDLRGCSWEHGHPEDPIEYSLDGDGMRRAGTPVRGPRLCQVCQSLVDEVGICTGCGYFEEPKETEITGDPLLKFEAKRNESPQETQSTLFRWAAEGKARGFKPGWLFHKYKAVYGRTINMDECRRLLGK